LKMLPRFSLNQFYKFFLGTVILCPTFTFSQTTPLATPDSTEYPGIIQTFEKLIQIDSEKFSKRIDALMKTGRIFGGANTVANLELEPDFLNSIILHSDPGYLRLASSDKCRFYETILTDLLKSSEGKIKNVPITYVEKDTRQSALISKKDFLAKIINQECPETQKNIAAFQVKTIEKTLKEINFDIPTGIDQCRNIHVGWINNPKTPFLCQIYEYIKEAQNGSGDPKDLLQRKAVAKILDAKQTLVQKDYIENICQHLDNEDLFCEEFLNVSFWTKIAAGYEDKIFAEDICKGLLKVNNNLSETQFATCLARMKKEKDICLYPAGINSSIKPEPDCDQTSKALNYSSLKVTYRDCPGNSDQMVATNMSRIINHFGSGEIVNSQGPCSAISALDTLVFNRNYDNDENWKLEACYEDRLSEKEICTKTFFGNYANQREAYSNVVAEILKKTRGADQSQVCEMVDSVDYNPLLLKFKSGCYIIYERDQCFISQCKHKIIYNDRKIDFISIKGRATIPYFPLTVHDERFSQSYLLTHDFKKKGRQMSTLSNSISFFKKSQRGIIHGIGCAEELLPSFFKMSTINQCTAMPFILNGVIKEKDKVVFITRTAGDGLQAPRMLSWSIIFSAVKSYQRIHPLKLWTMYGLD
jgi:hypothetical protein